jgi:hypothetical protein
MWKKTKFNLLLVLIVILGIGSAVYFHSVVFGATSTINNTDTTYVSSTFNNSHPIVSDGLVMWLTMDGQETTPVSTTDKSGNGKYASRIGGVAATEGRIGQGFKFDGNTAVDDDYLSIPVLPTVNTSTVMMWFILDTLVLPSNHRMMFSGSLNAGSATYFSNTSNGLPNPFVSYKIGATQRTLNGAAVTAIGQWTHMAVTWDGSFIRMYINGVLSSTSIDLTGTGSLVGIDGGSGELGAFLGIPTGWAHSGKIDDFRIYNRVLSASEIMLTASVDSFIRTSTP